MVSCVINNVFGTAFTKPVLTATEHAIVGANATLVMNQVLKVDSLYTILYLKQIEMKHMLKCQLHVHVYI